MIPLEKHAAHVFLAGGSGLEKMNIVGRSCVGGSRGGKEPSGGRIWPRENEHCGEELDRREQGGEGTLGRADLAQRK